MPIVDEPTFSVSKGGTWRVELPMVYLWNGNRIEVPSGFTTDFASLPRTVRPLIGVNEAHRLPALLHDYLYSLGGEYKELKYTRKAADWAFMHFMRDAGVGLIKRNAMFRAVRMFGWLHTRWRHK